jgi:hypothetical protein
VENENGVCQASVGMGCQGRWLPMSHLRAKRTKPIANKSPSKATEELADEQTSGKQTQLDLGGGTP